MNLEKLLTKANEGLKYYEVRFITYDANIPVMGEEGEYMRRDGYAVYNKVSGVYEHTTTLLPGAIFQSQHLDQTLDGLLNPHEMEYPSLSDVPMDDVVAN